MTKKRKYGLIISVLFILTGCWEERSTIFYYINNETKHNLLIEYKATYGANPKIEYDSINSFQNKYFFIAAINAESFDVENSKSDTNLTFLKVLNIYRDNTKQITRNFFKKDLWEYSQSEEGGANYILTLDSALIFPKCSKLVMPFQ